MHTPACMIGASSSASPMGTCSYERTSAGEFLDKWVGSIQKNRELAGRELDTPMSKKRKNRKRLPISSVLDRARRSVPIGHRAPTRFPVDPETLAKGHGFNVRTRHHPSTDLRVGVAIERASRIGWVVLEVGPGKFDLYDGSGEGRLREVGIGEVMRHLGRVTRIRRAQEDGPTLFDRSHRMP